MTHSVAQSTTLTCPACRRPFPAEVWLIIDTAERPDLLARIRDSSLHAIPCPHCRHAGAVDAPLLLYRPGQTPPILFSPADQTTTEQDQEHAVGLINLLRQRLGSTWQDAWLARGLNAVPRQKLPAVLNGDPLAAEREVNAQASPAPERPRAEDPDAVRPRQATGREIAQNPFWAGLQALLQADSMASLLHVAQEHPVLLTDESAARVAEAAANARRQGAEQAANDLEQRYQLLRNTQRAAQEAGLSPEQTLAATTVLEQGLHDSPGLADVSALGQTILTFINARTWDDSQQIVEQHPELLSDQADALFGQLIAAAQASQVDGGAAEMEEHRALLRRCREVGIPRAFAEKMLPPEGLAEAERLGLAPEEFLAAARAAQDMPPAVREVLAELAASGAEIHSAEDLERALASRPDLQAKLEAAAPARGFDVPSEFESDWDQANEEKERYRRTNNHAALNAAAAAWERILSHPAFPAADARFQLAAMNNAGGVFLRCYWALGRLADLQRALDLWQQAVQATPPDSPDLPGYLNNLGNGLRARYAATGQWADLAEAIRVYEQAVQATPPDSPDLPQHLLEQGDVFAQIYILVENTDSLESAISCYEQATSLSLTIAPRILREVARRMLDMAKQLITHGKVADTLSLITRLQALAPQQIPTESDAPTSQEPETSTLIREAAVAYRTSPDHAFRHEQSLGLFRDVLSIASSVASALLEASASSAYSIALQALEMARQIDNKTGKAFELAQWVRNMVGFEFIEMEDAAEWPPQAAHLVHLAARHERDENWQAAIENYRQACELLIPANSDQELARSAEIGFRLALCLKQAGRWLESLKQQETNVAAYKKLGNLAGKANAYMEMGHIYQMMNLYDPALLYYSEAFYLYRQATEETTDEATRRTSRHGMANAKESLGNLEFQLKVLPKGSTDLEDAKALYLGLGMPGKAVIIAQTLENESNKQGGQYA